MTEAARVAAWVNRATDARLDRSRTTFTRLQGEASDETYLVADDNLTLVLRRPPAHTLDASAHSMSRGYEVIRVLDPTVLDAPLVGYCDDMLVLGVDFLLRSYVADSASLRGAARSPRARGSARVGASWTPSPSCRPSTGDPLGSGLRASRRLPGSPGPALGGALPPA